MRESIFSSSVRSFFIGLFGMAGIVFGLILGFSLLSAITGSSDSDIDTDYSTEILPNASGVRKKLSNDAPVILQMNINGVIGADDLDMKNFRQQLVESREGSLANDRVKALLLNIQTPGGTVVDSDGIYRAIKTYKEQYKVPVYAFVDGLCASGGMYVACAADKIFATDTSIIGSVGVVTPPFMNVSQLMDKFGVQSLTLTAGKDKDSMNPFRPWLPGESENFQQLIDYYYNDFVNIVTHNRPNLSKEKLTKDYGAKIYPAKIAQEYGYIDESGISLRETLKRLAQEIGIQDDYYQVVTLSKPWYTGLFKTSGMNAFSGVVKHQFDLGPESHPKLSNQFLYLYRPGM